MKKQILCLLLLMVLTFSACSTSPEEVPSALYLYYPRQTVSHSGDTILCAVGSTLDPASVDASTLLSQYLSAQPPAEGLPVLPVGWSLTSMHMQGDTVYLSFHGTVIPQIDSSVTCVCLTRTLLQLPTVRSVNIQCPGSSEAITLTLNDVLLADTGMLPQAEQVTLYFPDAQRRYLVAQNVSISPQESGDKPRFILTELLSQAENSGIPQGTSLLEISVENGICTVNLSSEFLQNAPESFASERMTVYSIVNSLTELPEISTVDLWVSGAPLDRLRYLDLRSGVARDSSLLSAALGEDRLDVNLYHAVGETGLLAPIPMILNLQEDIGTTELLVAALIEDETSNGLINCIPEGTKLLSCRMEGSTCVLDFTGEFLAGCQDDREETLAVRAMIATVSQLPGISAVEILVEGIEPSYRVPALAQLRVPLADWFVE